MKRYDWKELKGEGVVVELAGEGKTTSYRQLHHHVLTPKFLVHVPLLLALPCG